MGSREREAQLQRAGVGSSSGGERKAAAAATQIEPTAIEGAVLVDRASGCAGGSSELCWWIERAAVVEGKGSSSGDADRTNGDRASGCAGGSSERRWRQRAARAAV
ncbi:hypothetical protein ACOSP7_019906 [Xanthoceras sorbifolium]